MNKFSNLARVRGVALTVVSALALAACATPTPYQPAPPRGASSAGYGFTDQQIEANRFRVTFAGNSLTSRETVETYLLYRAAELTIARGFDWFEMAGRDTERKSSTYVNQPFGGGPYGWWGPSWRFGGAFGWRSWDPYWGGPFGGGYGGWGGPIDVTTVDRYEAMAEIVTGRGAKPADPRSFDAREVVGNLQSRIVLPEPRR